MHDHDTASETPRRKVRRATLGAAALGVAALGGIAAAAASGVASADTSYHHRPDIRLVVNNPMPHDIAGRNGDFTVLVTATALNAHGNQQLSAANGYRPGLNLPPARTFGPGLPDPDAPGLVVTLSTTPDAAGGPQANLAGVFQLNTVTRHDGLRRVINDWEVGSPGFFGKNVQARLTAFLVRGTAPGMVTGHEQPISNVVHETFTIGG
jgi:hypothetical protein